MPADKDILARARETGRVSGGNNSSCPYCYNQVAVQRQTGRNCRLRFAFPVLDVNRKNSYVEKATLV
jgi:hypothetical protein